MCYFVISTCVSNNKPPIEEQQKLALFADGELMALITTIFLSTVAAVVAALIILSNRGVYLGQISGIGSLGLTAATVIIGVAGAAVLTELITLIINMARHISRLFEINKSLRDTSSLHKVNEELKQAKADLQKAQEGYGKILSEKSRLQLEIKKLSAASDDAQQQMIKEYDKKLLKAKARVSEKEGEVTSLKATLNNRTAGADDTLKNRITQLEAENLTLQTQLKASKKVEELEQEVKAKKQELETLENKRQKKLKEDTQLDAEKLNSREEITKLKDQTRAAAEELQNQEKAKAVAVQSTEEAKTALAKLREECDKTRKFLHEAQEELKRREEASNNSKIADTRQKEEHEKETARQKNHIESLKKEVALLVAEQTKMRAEIEKQAKEMGSDVIEQAKKVAEELENEAKVKQQKTLDETADKAEELLKQAITIAKNKSREEMKTLADEAKENMRKEAEEHVKKISVAEERLKDLEKQEGDIRNVILPSLNKTKDDLATEISRLNQATDTANALYNQKIADNQGEDQKANTLKEEVKNLEGQVTSLLKKLEEIHNITSEAKEDEQALIVAQKNELNSLNKSGDLTGTGTFTDATIDASESGGAKNNEFEELFEDFTIIGNETTGKKTPVLHDTPIQEESELIVIENEELNGSKSTTNGAGQTVSSKSPPTSPEATPKEVKKIDVKIEDLQETNFRALQKALYYYMNGIHDQQHQFDLAALNFESLKPGAQDSYYVMQGSSTGENILKALNKGVSKKEDEQTIESLDKLAKSIYGQVQAIDNEQDENEKPAKIKALNKDCDIMKGHLKKIEKVNFGKNFKFPQLFSKGAK
jgi:hypothetical protein